MAIVECDVCSHEVFAEEPVVSEIVSRKMGKAIKNLNGAEFE